MQTGGIFEFINSGSRVSIPTEPLTLAEISETAVEGWHKERLDREKAFEEMVALMNGFIYLAEQKKKNRDVV